MESRIETAAPNMSDEYALGGQQKNKRKSFLGRFAGYAKQMLKGTGILTVGVLGYFSIKGLGRKEKEEKLASEETGLKAVLKTKPESHKQDLQLSLSSNSHDELSKRSLSAGREFQVSTYLWGDQTNPVISEDKDGGFVVTWQSNKDGSGFDIYAQLFDSRGSRVGSEFPVNTFTTYDQSDASVAVLKNKGNFVIVWQSNFQDGSSWGIYGQLFDSSAKKIGSEFAVNNFTNDIQNGPDAVAMSSGNFVAIWQSYKQDGSTWGVYGQLFDSSAGKIGSEFSVNTYTYGAQRTSTRGNSIAVFSNDNFVVTWESYNQDGSSWGIYGQLFDSSAKKMGSEFLINTYTIGSQSGQSVFTLTNDNFIVVWQSNYQVGSSWDIVAQLFDSSANKLGSEFQVNAYTQNEQWNPTVSKFGPDKFIVMWTSLSEGPYSSISKGKLYALNATALGNEFYISQYDSQYPVMASNNDSALVCWEYLGRDGSGFGIFGRIFKQTISGTNDHISRIYTQDQTYLFSADPFTVDIFYNPNVTLTLTLSDKNAGTFKSITLPNVLSTFNTGNGQWQLKGELYGVNKLLTNLIFQPTQYFNKNFTVTLSVHDGISPDYTSRFKMQGIPVNIAPVIVNNQMTLEAGKVKLIQIGDLKATDVDNPADTLQFSVTGVTNGQFELVNKPNKAIARFSQSEIMNNNLQFRPDGSNNPPSYNITVSDGQLSSLPSEAQINFIAGKGLSRSATAGIVVTVALVSGAGLALGVGIWRHSATRKKAKQRAKAPLANKIYEKLSLKKVEDFKSGMGRIYVGIINQMDAEFAKQLNYDVDTMASDALDEFADYIVQAIEQNVTVKHTRFYGAKLDWADVQSKLDRIVKDTVTAIEKDGWVPRQGKVKEKFNFNEEHEVEMVPKSQLREPLITTDMDMSHR